MGSVERRLRRLEAQSPTARTEEEIGAEACSRMSTEDLVTLQKTGRRLEQRLEERGGDESLEEAIRDELMEEERAAFESAYARYEEAAREARAGRYGLYPVGQNSRRDETSPERSGV